MIVNREAVNDATKLIMHRLISRRLAHDPALIDRAKKALQKIARRYAGRPFVEEWDKILSLPAPQVRAKLISRNSDMIRLRSSSPFVGVGIDFTDYDLRIRIGRAANRLARRQFSKSSLPADSIYT